MTKLLTVAVAAYNVEDTLQEALECFTAPGIRECVEVLVVDDGSTDHTAQIARSYEEQYPGTFRLISKENGGWGSTLNAAMEAASGKYFKQLDGDDRFMTENLPRFLRLLETSDADMIWSAYVVFDAVSKGTMFVEGRSRELTGICRYPDEDHPEVPAFSTLAMQEIGRFVPDMPSITVRTDVLREHRIQMTEHCFYASLEFVLKVYHHCTSFTYFELPVYMYRVNREGQSMSVTGIRRHYRDHQKILQKCLEYWDQEVQDPIKRKALQQPLEKACTMQYMFYYALECTPEQRKELAAFDRFMLEHYPEFLRDAEGGNRLRILRKLNYHGYRYLGPQNTRQDKQLRRHIFEKT